MRSGILQLNVCVYSSSVHYHACDLVLALGGGAAGDALLWDNVAKRGSYPSGLLAACWYTGTHAHMHTYAHAEGLRVQCYLDRTLL